MKYRKKPVVIDAIQFEYSIDGIIALKLFCGDALGKVSCDRHPNAIAEAEIGTLEDGQHMKVKHIATAGDYIVKGIQGEFYAVKSDIFELTYEKVEV